MNLRMTDLRPTKTKRMNDVSDNERMRKMKRIICLTVLVFCVMLMVLSASASQIDVRTSTESNTIIGESMPENNPTDGILPILPRALNTYSHTNSATLAPVKVTFNVSIDVQKKADGTYYIYAKTIGAPNIVNSGSSSFQYSRTSDSFIDGGRGWKVIHTGEFVKDGVKMGTKSISCVFYVNSTTGKVGSSNL